MTTDFSVQECVDRSIIKVPVHTDNHHCILVTMKDTKVKNPG